MGWRYSSTVDITANVDVREIVENDPDKVLALWTNDELKEEIENREKDGFKHYNELCKDIYRYGLTVETEVEVDVDDVLDEVSDNKIYDYARKIGYKGEVELETVRELNFKDIIVNYFNINKFAYNDEEIMELVKKELKK
jgi:membrane carboxypeptidase/penicillin-binding protein